MMEFINSSQLSMMAIYLTLMKSNQYFISFVLPIHYCGLRIRCSVFRLLHCYAQMSFITYFIHV